MRLPKDKQAVLLDDLVNASVQEENEDCSRIIFNICGYVRPQYRGQHSYGIEGSLQDMDGTSVSVDLFADENNRLLEMELIRWGNGNLQKPDWATLSLLD
jgi:hypothetical protein